MRILNFLKQLKCIALILILSNSLYAQSPITPYVNYVSPKPNSYLNHPETNIIIHFLLPVSKNDLEGKFIISSNNHEIKYNIQILDDAKTILIDPSMDLPSDTKITVKLLNDLTLADETVIHPFAFDFYVTSNLSSSFINNEIAEINANVPESPRVNNPIHHIVSTSSYITSSTPLSTKIARQIPVTVLKNTNQNLNAYYFVSTISYNTTYPNRCMILDANGNIVYDRITKSYALDFKMLSDSLISYFDWDGDCYIVMDLNFNVVDTVRAGNGYITDNHELKYDKHTGHYFILAQQNAPVNMADSVVGGNANAMVLGSIIQEIGKNKSVVFEWKTLDYLPITDAVGVNLGASNIDYIHCNSIDLDTDTTLLLSSRHLNEIERIDRRTGRLIWRFGKPAKNQMFTFINDTSGFSYQHSANRLPNGHILLYDNGNYRYGVRSSRAVEYMIDEENHTADMVWEYKNSPDVVSDFMGSAQRLTNGNTLIGWGGASTTFTEVDPSNNKIFEAALPSWAYSYRAFRYDKQAEFIKNFEPLISTLPDTLYFCNQSPSFIKSNINNYIQPYLPSSYTSSDYALNFDLLDSKKVLLTTGNSNGFYAYANTHLKFNASYLPTKDTSVCASLGLKLNIINECNNARFKWSTDDTTQSVILNPTLNSSTYWVDIITGNNIRRDSVHVSVSDVTDFQILGEQVLASPYKILTYSVPFDPAYSYTWNIKNGNIIGGYNTNAVTVQWGNQNLSLLTASIKNNFGCVRSHTDSVLYLKVTTDVSEQSVKDGMSVYPNPANDILYIEFDGAFTYKMTDLAGRVISFSTDSNIDKTTIDMSELNQGYYLLDIESKNRIEHVKVLKN